MKKQFGAFLFGVSSIFTNVFGNPDMLPLAEGGFAGDKMRLKQDFNKIAADFNRVTYRAQQNQDKC